MLTVMKGKVRLSLLANCTHICGNKLLLVIDAVHRDLPLADEGVVIGVGCDKEHL